MEGFEIKVANGVKCSTDATAGRLRSEWGYGAIVRNDRGDFIKGLSGHLTMVTNPKLAQALAIREVFSWFRSFSFERWKLRLITHWSFEPWIRKI